MRILDTRHSTKIDTIQKTRLSWENPRAAKHSVKIIDANKGSLRRAFSFLASGITHDLHFLRKRPKARYLPHSTPLIGGESMAKRMHEKEGIAGVTWIVLLVIAGWGGLVRYLIDIRQNKVAWSWVNALAQMVVSGFTGVIGGLISIESGLSIYDSGYSRDKRRDGIGCPHVFLGKVYRGKVQ
jgi:hypothetical protein